MTVIVKKKLSEKVVDEIRKRMENGELKIGDKLPNQNELALEMGVSRTSLREAMNILALLGIVEQKPGYGTAIRKKVPEINPKGLKPTLLSDSKTTRELLEARQIIEIGAVQLTAYHATKSQAKKITKLVNRMQEMLDKREYLRYAQEDLKFHIIITEFSKNRFLNEAFVSIKQYMRLFMQEHTQLLPNVLAEVQKHHEAICNAISNNDPEKAGFEMEKHIQFLKANFKNYRQDSSSATRKK